MGSLSHQRIFITGGTGTFGNSLCKYIFEKYDVPSITIFSRDENKQFHMKSKFREYKDKLNFIIGDVRDKEQLTFSMKDQNIVFHAAALKHVPVGEEFPKEAIKTNVNGIINVLEAAEENNVKRVINLSSDKAVQPINAYGMTKALSEKLVAAHQGNVVGVSLRYGNVIGSRGSVIPLFIDQAKRSHPFTVTDKNMTRFLLPVENAIKLAVFCAESSEVFFNKGCVIVAWSPACTVETLIEVINYHYNKIDLKYNPDRSKYRHISVIELGIRPGEKAHETLLTREESKKAIHDEEKGIKIFIVPPVAAGKIDNKVRDAFTSELTERCDFNKTYDLLKEVGIFDED